VSDPKEEERLLEQAMRCAASGSATHWPTVAGYLHDEVLRLRAQVDVMGRALQRGADDMRRDMTQSHSMLVDLNRAVYGCDTWPDRPLDSVWEHLLAQVRKAFGQEEVA
jgi:hypothetical protein